MSRHRIVVHLLVSALALTSALVAPAGAQFTELATVRPDLPPGLQGFGQEVSVSGDLAAVMSTLRADGADHQDVWVHIYRRSGQLWQLEARLIVARNAVGGWAPGALLLRGERLYVAIPDPAESNVGVVHVRERNAGGTHFWGEVDQVRADLPRYVDLFAADIDADGDLLVVAAPVLFQPLGGAAYVFTRQPSGDFVETAMLYPDDSAPLDGFGQRVAVSGQTIAVSANGGVPRVYLFELADGEWVEVARVPIGDGTTLFTPDVALEGDVFATQAEPRSGLGDGVGLFERGADGWSPILDLRPGPFASRIVLAGDHLAFGGAGGVYVTRRQDEGWDPPELLSSTAVTAGSGLGSALDTDGHSFVLGAPGDSEMGAGVGAAVLFTAPEPLFDDDFESGGLVEWSATLGAELVAPAGAWR